MKAIGESDHRMRGVAKGRTTIAQNCGKIRKNVKFGSNSAELRPQRVQTID